MKTIFLLAFFAPVAQAQLADYEWIKADRPALPYTVEYVDNYTELLRDCTGVNRTKKGFLMGCARYNVKENWCKIYIGPSTVQRATLEHEKKHCEGYDHE